MDERNPLIGFIGAGALGKGLALALASQGYRVVGAHSRSAGSAQALAGRLPGCRAFATAQELADAVDLVFITTPDSAIRQVAAGVTWRPGQGVVHCSGAASVEILQPASDQGAVAGAFHPLQSFAGLADPMDAASRLTGVTFAVAGSSWLSKFLWDMAGQLGGRPISISDADRPLYHCAAGFASVYLPALLQAAADMLETMGFSEQQAVQSLYPLFRVTPDTAAQKGVAASAAGAIVRGDVSTVHSHLEALFQRLPDLLPLYGVLAAASLPLAARHGVGPGQISAMEELIDHYTGAE